MGLCERRRSILKAVINDYVETAEPVGSETLARKYDFGVKPATIRNELAAMSELGYLRQPHTSAGRIPSDLGYRFYVDELMPEPHLGPDETAHARRSYDPFESEIEEILQRTCRILSGLTRYTSIATAPQMDTISIKQVALLLIGAGKLLAVIVMNNGRIDHRSVDSNIDLKLDKVTAMTNFINERFQDADLHELIRKTDMELPSEIAGMHDLYRRVIYVLKQALSMNDEDEIFVTGTSNILKQPEFTGSDRLASLLDALESRRDLFQVFSQSLLGKEVTVVIGAENLVDEMRECSFVTSSYTIGKRVCGSIAVIGPTRMDYRRAVAAVEFMAMNLSGLLTSLSIG
ncbi:heat-inducible transcriptional repressor HrcA [uncultured Desulfobulbus sp.]|uniref:heat-inducible transcriptional repressor HrcA n=1 Tax=uncultured Desulfobulbus sp. TaxID=239745 RepID=UPI0029C942CC|nr:heat-inducible transcriptional repressor HrcA [uncultured Desulfobulbus sp.]